MPYLSQVGGDHRRKGIWFRWMGVFHCPVRPCSFPPLPSAAYSPLLTTSSSLPTLPALRPPFLAKAMRPSIHASLTLPVWAEHTHVHIPVELRGSVSPCHTTSMARRCTWLKITLGCVGYFQSRSASLVANSKQKEHFWRRHLNFALHTKCVFL